MPVRLLIADDQEMVRRGMRRILERQPDMEVVGEAADGVEAVEPARRLTPDVAPVGIRMPRRDSLEVTRLLAGPEAPHPVHVVVATTFDLDAYVYPALRFGASGFLLKRSGPALLIEGARAAMAGDSPISPSNTVRLFQHLTGNSVERNHGRRSRKLRRNENLLTHREIEIAGKFAQGMTNSEVAAEPFISPGTVKTDLAGIQRKLASVTVSD